MNRRSMIAMISGGVASVSAGCVGASGGTGDESATDANEETNTMNTADHSGCGTDWINPPKDPGEVYSDIDIDTDSRVTHPTLDRRVTLSSPEFVNEIDIGSEDMGGAGPRSISIKNTAGIDHVCVGIVNRNDPEIDWGTDDLPDSEILHNEQFSIPEGKGILFTIHRAGRHYVVISNPDTGAIHEMEISILRPEAMGRNGTTYVEIFGPDDIGSISISPL